MRGGKATTLEVRGGQATGRGASCRTYTAQDIRKSAAAHYIFVRVFIILLGFNASPWILARIRDCEGLKPGPALAPCGVHAPPLRATQPGAREKTGGQKISVWCSAKKYAFNMVNRDIPGTRGKLFLMYQ